MMQCLIYKKDERGKNMLDSDLEIMKKAAFNKADICNNHLGKYFIRAIVAGFFIVVATMLSNVTAACFD